MPDENHIPCQREDSWDRNQARVPALDEMQATDTEKKKARFLQTGGDYFTGE